MPDSTGPVRLAPLKSLANGHFWALVAFPADWQRLRPGHYEVDEDFLLLSGDLRINERQWRAREHGEIGHRPSWQDLPRTDFMDLGRAPHVFEHAGMSQWLLSPALRDALCSRTPPFDELDLGAVDAALAPAFWVRLPSPLALS